MNSNCGCNKRNSLNNNMNMISDNIFETNYIQSYLFPKNYMYGHAYVPHQTLGNVFSPEDGLKHGTIFPELATGYYAEQSSRIRGCLGDNVVERGGYYDV